MANKKIEKTELIEQVINLLKEQPVVKTMFDRFEIDPEYIHKIQIKFGPIDVSAKATREGITINEKFLEDGNVVDDLHYIVHELVHALQYLAGYVDKVKVLKFEHYLDNPLELQAFREQIRFIKDYKGQEQADEYLNDLLDFHGIDGEERAGKAAFLGS